MGTVSGQQHAVLAPAIGDQSVEAVDGLAVNLDALGTVPTAEKIADKSVVQRLFGSLTGQQHKLPSMATRSHQNAGGGPRRITDLEVYGRHQVGLLDLCVDHQPRLVKFQIEQRQASGLAHRTAGPVAADQILRPHGGQALRGVNQGDNPIAILFKILELPI